MATIKPFRGIRPPKDLVEQVASRPYDVLNSEEAREEAKGNEKSLYHIIRPEIGRTCSGSISESGRKLQEVPGKRLAGTRSEGMLLCICADHERKDPIRSCRMCLRSGLYERCHQEA